MSPAKRLEHPKHLTPPITAIEDRTPVELFHEAFIRYSPQGQAVDERRQALRLDLAYERERVRRVFGDLIRLGLRPAYFQYFHPGMPEALSRYYRDVWKEVHGGRPSGQTKTCVRSTIRTNAEACALSAGYSMHLAYTYKLAPDRLRPASKPNPTDPFALHHAYRSLTLALSRKPPFGPEILLLAAIEAAGSLTHPSPYSTLFVTRCANPRCSMRRLLILADCMTRYLCPFCKGTLPAPDYWRAATTTVRAHGVTDLCKWRETQKPAALSVSRRTGRRRASTK